MRFKWDSNVARDIASELNRLEGEVGECAVANNRAAAILRDMSGSFGEDLGEIVQKYVSVIQGLSKQIARLEDAVEETSQGITRGNELFEGLETTLRTKAMRVVEGDMGQMTSAFATYSPNLDMPMFYNFPTPKSDVPPMFTVAAEENWSVFPGLQTAVEIDQMPGDIGVIVPTWLQGIIDTD